MGDGMVAIPRPHGGPLAGCGAGALLRLVMDTENVCDRWLAVRTTRPVWRTTVRTYVRTGRLLHVPWPAPLCASNTYNVTDELTRGGGSRSH
jgi:hypothetical protein